ncbi:LysR substrate-binding domain-containing protein [Sessilibacter sp. MAH2]
MDRRNLPLSALRAFESAAECLHLGRAGEKLGVSHGAISHQVRALEEQLSVKLFSRAHNKLALTPAGQRLYQSVKDGFDKIADATRNLNPLELSGPLVVACTQTIASSWAAKHICEFYQKYPSIELRVREIEPLQKDIPLDIDIAICYGRPNSGDRSVKKLGAPPLYPVCSPTILQGRAPVNNPDDLSSFTIIHDGEVLWSRWFERYGVDPDSPKSNIYFSNTSQALAAARLGYGVALGNTFEAYDFIRDGQLVQLFDLPIDEAHEYYLLTQTEANKPLKVSIFEEWITRDRLIEDE